MAMILEKSADELGFSLSGPAARLLLVLASILDVSEWRRLQQEVIAGHFGWSQSLVSRSLSELIRFYAIEKRRNDGVVEYRISSPIKYRGEIQRNKLRSVVIKFSNDTKPENKKSDQKFA